MNVIELAAAQLDRFQPATRPDPIPGRGEVLVRLRAASLNFLDIAVATGKYPLNTFPIIPVTDGAGEVAELGEGVAAWTVGDRVIPHFLPYWQDGRLPEAGGGPRRGIDLQGSLAEYVVVPASSLVRTPDHLSHEEAATLPIAATTAWQTIQTAALGPQKTALVLGTGGVSLFALQLVKAYGARALITTSSAEKAERCKALGADSVINYRETPVWSAEVLRMTAGQGADYILETGGSATLPQSIKSAALDSTVVVIGFLSGTETTVNVLELMEKRVRLQGNVTGPISALRDVAATISRHRIKPVIDRVFDWHDVSQAYEYVASGSHFGKVVLAVGQR